jgi:hypothetical protein
VFSKTAEKLRCLDEKGVARPLDMVLTLPKLNAILKTFNSRKSQTF